MSHFKAYRHLVTALFLGRLQGITAGHEERILDHMDILWERMNLPERQAADRLSDSLAVQYPDIPATELTPKVLDLLYAWCATSPDQGTGAWEAFMHEVDLQARQDEEPSHE